MKFTNSLGIMTETGCLRGGKIDVLPQNSPFFRKIGYYRLNF